MPSHSLEGKSILITGGTGSFGQAMSRKLLMHKPKHIIIYSRDECKQWQMQQDLKSESNRFKFFIGCVRDKERLRTAFRNCDIVIHAAALKQVPAAEYNPLEFIKTNIDGTSNVVEAAIENNVEKVISLSTDKAVHPLNLYGATKLCGEKLTISANIHANNSTKLSVVRYGNVMGSRGSVIPRWMELAHQGERKLPVTSLDMTRFWLTLEEASDLVLTALKDMHGGEIFVPKIQSFSIRELLKSMSELFTSPFHADEIGIRPGEKMHEQLVAKEESHFSFESSLYYILLPYLAKSDPYHHVREYWLQSLPKKDPFHFCSNEARLFKSPQIKILLEKFMH